ncbi:MAG TPA: HAD family hydrolase [Rhodothermales bacterium]|nr:HAD family hydrolase [Rhodothermales bacterium]
MPVRALLLDLDGTLVDTNAAHAAAFADAFAEAGYDVPYERVRRAIGLGSSFLVPELIGEAAAQKDGAEIEKRTGERFAEIARSESFRLLFGAEALIVVARRRGLQLALCTASETAELDLMFGSVGTDLRPEFDVVTTASDVSEPKPEPDVVHVALDRLGLPPEACLLVGDTRFDGETAARAGVAFIGVTTGAWTAEELKEAGAVAVYADAAALVMALDEALAAADAAVRV